MKKRVVVQAMVKMTIRTDSKRELSEIVREIIENIDYGVAGIPETVIMEKAVFEYGPDGPFQNFGVISVTDLE